MNDSSLRGVLDTNVLVSALLFPASVPRKALDTIVDNGTVLLSVPQLLEIADVLARDRFDKYLTQEERMRFLVGFLKISEMVAVTETLSICRDPKDNKLLELAVSGRSDYLITGDEDLLALDPFRNVRIRTPRNFLQEVVGNE